MRPEGLGHAEVRPCGRQSPPPPNRRTAVRRSVFAAAVAVPTSCDRPANAFTTDVHGTPSATRPTARRVRRWARRRVLTFSGIAGHTAARPTVGNRECPHSLGPAFGSRAHRTLRPGTTGLAVIEDPPGRIRAVAMIAIGELTLGRDHAPVREGHSRRPDLRPARRAPEEQGTHAELLATGGRYAELFTLQASGYTTEGDNA
jgi:hypothetical protein